MPQTDDKQPLLDELVRLADRLGVGIQRVRRAGEGGGLIRVGRRWQLIIDTDADPGEELARLAGQMSLTLDLENTYISPALREHLENSTG